MSDPPKLWMLDARTIARGVGDGSLSALEVVGSVLDRIAEVNDSLHAFCTVDAGHAREVAASIDRRVRAGEPVGPLAGVPVGVKDVLFTQGLRTTGCCVAYQDFVPDYDDVAVSRLRNADAVVVGKTTTSELAYGPGRNPVSPQTANPWDVSLTPGNSSSGSAAAVATGMGPISLGTDGGGSIRCPASFCGVFGLKPSRGRVPSFRDPRYPGLSSWRSLGTTGPITRTVHDAALTMSVIAGPDPRDRVALPALTADWLSATEPASLSGLRLVHSLDWGHATVDDAVRRCFQGALELLADGLGATLVEADPPWGDPSAVTEVMVAADADLEGMRRLREQHPSFGSPSINALLDHDWTAEDFTTAMMASDALCAQMSDYMTGFDVLVTPTIASLPFPLTEEGPYDAAGRLRPIADWCPFTQLMNHTGQPAASVPIGSTPEGIPVGMQIVGGKFDDLLVLRVAAAIEAAQPWRELWPPIA